MMPAVSDFERTRMTKLRLAIVGAGPAGIYAADIILKAERKFDVSIDLFEQLPAPYGLVRYGVAPDHPRIKGIVTALREVLDRLNRAGESVWIYGASTKGNTIAQYCGLTVADTPFATKLALCGV